MDGCQKYTVHDGNVTARHNATPPPIEPAGQTILKCQPIDDQIMMDRRYDAASISIGHHAARSRPYDRHIDKIDNSGSSVNGPLKPESKSPL